MELSFANPEAHQISSFKSFYRALIPSPAPSTTSEKIGDWADRYLLVFLVTKPAVKLCNTNSDMILSHMDVMSAN